MADAGIFDLKGRIAMVTGAGQGVGRGIALTLAAHHAGGIVVNDFYAERANAVVEEIKAIGVPACAMVADVGELDQVQAGLAAAEAELGPVSILVNNAGNAGPSGYASEFPLFWESNPATWRRFLHVNLYGVMNCCHAAVRGMVERRYGRVVTIISDASRNLEPRQADYAAAKAGAAGFMRGLAADAARYGVTANNISIASIRPPMQPDEFQAYMSSERVKQQMQHYAIRRYGLPEDVAAVALLLCSDAASWITGQTYPVNGGYSVTL